MRTYHTRLETRKLETGRTGLGPASRPDFAFFDLVGVVSPVRGMRRSCSLAREEFFLALPKLFDEFVRNAFKSEKLGHGHDLGGALHVERTCRPRR